MFFSMLLMSFSMSLLSIPIVRRRVTTNTPAILTDIFEVLKSNGELYNYAPSLSVLFSFAGACNVLFAVNLRTVLFIKAVYISVFQFCFNLKRSPSSVLN